MNALILIDIQNDFMPGGPLGVPEGDQVTPIANRLMPRFDRVVATQDWHPADHGSFAAQHPGRHPGELIQLNGLPQVLWPTHCVAGTHGAEFVSGLDQSSIHKVFRKGTDAAVDSYSGFFDNGHRKATGLGDWLRAEGVTAVTLVGVATDYCVRYTAEDAVRMGLHTTLLLAGCRGVELKAGDVAAALAALRALGVHIAVGEAPGEPSGERR